MIKVTGFRYYNIWIKKYLIWCSYILISCTNQPLESARDFEDSEFHELKIEFIEDINLSSLVEGFTYVPLETDSLKLIGYVNKVVFQNNSFYLLDKRASRSIFCFDRFGKIKFRISSYGPGDGEYQNPSDFFVTPSNKILVSDPLGTLLGFNSVGKFLFERKIDFYIEEMVMLDSTRYLVYGPSDTIWPERKGQEYKRTLFVFSNDFEQLYQSYFSYTEFEEVMESNILSSYDNVCTFARSMHQKFYLIDSSGKLKPRFIINFGKYNAPFELFNDPSNRDKIERLYFDGQFASLINNINETENYFTFQFYLGGQHKKENKWLGIYNKASDKVYAIHNVHNDIDGGVFGFPKETKGNEYISIVYAEDLIEHMKVEQNNWDDPTIKSYKNHQLLKAMIDTISYSDNPILMIYKLKENIVL